MRHRFGCVEMDCGRREFLVDGEPQRLEPQVFDLIALLIECRDRVVTRDELVAKIWSGRIVSDATIDARISAARRAVGDTGRVQAVIRTIPRRGIRFVGALEDGTPTRGQELRPAEGFKPSIAVLPFEDQSEHRDRAYLARGLTSDIITTLAKLSDIHVTDRTTAFVLGGDQKEPSVIAKSLAVGNILNGSIRLAGDRLRVTVQLIDAESARLRWAERYDRDIEHLFEVQDSITQAVVTALQVRLTEGEQAALRRRHTENFQAWQKMMEGLLRLRRFTFDETRAARQAFEQALAEDPAFGPAWGMLAWTHLVDARLGYTESATVALAQGAALAEEGLAIDPDDPDTLAILGALRLFQRMFDQADLLTRRAVDRGPSLAEVLMWRATVLNYTGRPAEALTWIDKAMQLSPYYPDWFLGIRGVSYRCLGRFDDAIAADQQRLQRNPDNPLSNFRLAAVYAETGRIEEARAEISDLLIKNPKACLDQVAISEPYQDQKELTNYLQLLRDAGLQERSWTKVGQ